MLLLTRLAVLAPTTAHCSSSLLGVAMQAHTSVHACQLKKAFQTTVFQGIAKPLSPAYSTSLPSSPMTGGLVWPKAACDWRAWEAKGNSFHLSQKQSPSVGCHLALLLRLDSKTPRWTVSANSCSWLQARPGQGRQHRPGHTLPCPAQFQGDTASSD